MDIILIVAIVAVGIGFMLILDQVQFLSFKKEMAEIESFMLKATERNTAELLKTQRQIQESLWTQEEHLARREEVEKQLIEALMKLEAMRKELEEGSP